MSRFLLVCFAGAVGTGARYLIGTWIARSGPVFPWATLSVNVLGSFVISLVMQVALNTTSVTDTWGLALTTGLMGGFTTYSAFNYETLALLDKGAWGLAAANVAVTLLACLLAGMAGWWVGLRLAG